MKSEKSKKTGYTIAAKEQSTSECDQIINDREAAECISIRWIA